MKIFSMHIESLFRKAAKYRTLFVYFKDSFFHLDFLTSQYNIIIPARIAFINLYGWAGTVWIYEQFWCKQHVTFKFITFQKINTRAFKLGVTYTYIRRIQSHFFFSFLAQHAHTSFCAILFDTMRSDYHMVFFDVAALSAPYVRTVLSVLYSISHSYFT